MFEDQTFKNEAVPNSAESATGTSPASAELFRTAADPDLTEDLALALLKRPDLPPDILEKLAKNINAVRSRKVRVALASHAKSPRHVSVPLVRQLYAFDLVKIALSPSVPADVKVVADDTLISRLKALTLGERLTLARRASGRVAAALLLDVKNMDGKIKTAEVKGGKIKNAQTMAHETRVMHTALENPRLTETLVINSVLGPDAGADLVQAVAQHAKWSCRREIRAALLRTKYLSLARALEFSNEIPASLLHELLASSRLPEQIKHQLRREQVEKT
jgi:hypothetical protein